MDINEFLDGESLTGRQAGLVFIGFLSFVVLSGVALVLFRGLF
ncbi:hypothetical protein [Natrinema salinisoli]|nr:hypothetical protein [Natrinema salinisoli]